MNVWMFIVVAINPISILGDGAILPRKLASLLF